MGKKTDKEENGRPIVLNLVAIIGYGFLAYVMWPDIKEQIGNMRHSGAETYAVVITCFFTLVLLVVLLCFIDVLKRIMK